MIYFHIKIYQNKCGTLNMAVYNKRVYTFKQSLNRLNSIWLRSSTTTASPHVYLSFLLSPQFFLFFSRKRERCRVRVETWRSVRLHARNIWCVCILSAIRVLLLLLLCIYYLHLTKYITHLYVQKRTKYLNAYMHVSFSSKLF